MATEPSSVAPGAAPPGRGSRTSPVGILLVALMAIGSVVMWIVIPYAWIWLASQLQKGVNPSGGPYVMVLFGVPVSMFLMGKLLGRLDRVHSRVTGADAQGRAQLPWLKSLRGERSPRRGGGVLEVVMVWSVGIALLAFGVWFFAFAGSSLPT